MAPKFVLRVVRQPLSGKVFEVLEDVLKYRRETGLTNGVTTLGVFSLGSQVITTTPYDSLEAAQEAAEGVLSDSDRRKAFDAIGAKCSSVRTPLSRIIEPADGRDDAEWVHRYVFQHKPTARQELIAALQEFRSHQDTPKFGITASLNSTSIVVSTAMQSLSLAEERGDQLMSDPGTQARAAAALEHVDSWNAGIARVYRS